MKFSHSLKFNSVPGWNDNYLKYPSLKKSIYKLQEDQLTNNGNQNQGFIVGSDKTTITELLESLKNQNGFGDDTIESSSSSNDNFGNNVKNRITKNLNIFQRFNSKNNVFSDSNNSSEIELHHIDLEKNEKTDSKSGEDSVTTIVSSQKNSDQYIINHIVHMDNDEFEETFANPKSLKFNPLYVFTRLLLIELVKINEFYQLKEREIFIQYHNLLQDLKNNQIDIVHSYTIDPTLIQEPQNQRRRLSSNFDIEFHDLEKNASTLAVQEDTDDEDDEDFHSDHSDVLLDASHFNVKHQFKVAVKKRSISLFINLCELKSYIELNRQGFTKICKKFDKICGYQIKEDFVNHFLPLHSRVFENSTIVNLNNKVDEVIKIYALFSNQLNSSPKDLENVKQELRSHLRDHIVFERNTVWKDLLSLEKNSYNLNLDNGNTINKKMGDEGDVIDSMMHLKMKEIQLPQKLGGKTFKVPEFLITKQVMKILLTVIVFAILISVKTFNDPVQGRALAVLVACAMLWASEALPLYATGLFVPLLVVTCRICKIEGTQEPMSAPDASKYILSTMWNSTIMVLMGGFTISAALSKYNLAKILSSYILALAGTSFKKTLFAIMCVSWFLSMWISNTASPIICFSLISPVMKSLTNNLHASQALALGIAFAANIGGASTPISSPQNIIAFQNMKIASWGSFLGVSLPTTIISLILTYGLLLLTFQTKNIKLPKVQPIKEKLTSKQIFICIVSLATILLWCVMSQIEDTFGEAGIISIISMVLFFGTGILNTSDINQYPYNIVFLACGGIALGKGLISSELLVTIAKALQRRIEDFNVFAINVIFGVISVVIASFISHTVAALILIPLVKEVGQSLSKDHSSMLIFGTAMSASFAMSLPSSGFPNNTAISMVDSLGNRYLTVGTFIKRGFLATVICFIISITVGYGIMSSFGF